MRLLRLVPVLLAVVLLSACSGVPGIYTVEHPGDSTPNASGSGGPFDAATYAATVWKVDVPKAVAGAVPAADLAAQLASNPKDAQTAHGHNQGTGSPWSFVISGTATIADVDTSGPSTLLILKQDWWPNATVGIQVGPAMLGTAVRDSLGTVDFSKFVNQIDFADVATELNKHVLKDVVGPINPATLKGKEVTFVGAFNLSDPTNIVITPLKLEVAK